MFEQFELKKEQGKVLDVHAQQQEEKIGKDCPEKSKSYTGGGHVQRITTV